MDGRVPSPLTQRMPSICRGCPGSDPSLGDGWMFWYRGGLMAHLQEGELWQHAHQVWGAGSWALRTQSSVEDVGGPAGSMLRSTPPPQSQSLVWECHVNGRMTASSALGTPPHLRAPPRRCLSSRERLLLSTPTRSLGRTHVTPDPQHPIYLQEWGGCSSSSTPEQVVSTAGWLHRACSIRNAVSSSSCLM